MNDGGSASPRPTTGQSKADSLFVELADGRTAEVPLALYPRLRQGTPAERANFEIGPYGIHWPDLDEDVSVKNLLLGKKSGESAGSLKQWLDHRDRGEAVPVATRPLPDWMNDAK